MNCGIYLIVNMVNGKVYVGSSKNLKKRKEGHFRDLLTGKHLNPYLVSAWKKYRGHAFLSFIFQVVEYCDEADLLAREDWWIELLGTLDDAKGYNLISARRQVFSQRTRDKMSASHRGKAWSEEQRRRSMGRVKSPEEREKISRAHKGKPKSAEHIRKMAESKKGKTPTMTDKKREAYESSRGRKATAETSSKIRESLKGRPFSDEHKENLRKGWEKRRARALAEGVSPVVSKPRGPMSEEHRRKISQGTKGKAAWNKGVPRTEEAKQKALDTWARKRTDAAATDALGQV